jgi:hypothetical protein
MTMRSARGQTPRSKTWLLAQIEKQRAAPARGIKATAPDQPFAPERLAA